MDTTSQTIDTIFSFLRTMREKMNNKPGIRNVTMVQVFTLVFLKKNPGSPMKKIADFLQIELPSATNLVDNLVKKDYVLRKTDEKDKRLVTIALTKKGEAVVEEAKKERVNALGKVLSSLSEEEKKQLIVLLTKMTEGIKTNEK